MFTYLTNNYRVILWIRHSVHNDEQIRQIDILFRQISSGAKGIKIVTNGRKKNANS